MAPRPRSGQRSPHERESRATPPELLFDLVYVFAATQVTGYMAHKHGLHGLIQGLLLSAAPRSGIDFRY
jgi:low temperature requirement protein LtrA